MLGRQGALRTRTSELRAELARLRAQADALNQEQATYTTYDSRVKQMAGELLDHQAELADYNVLVELMNMDSERALVDSELDQLRHANGNEALLVEKLFLNRKEKENEERRLADTLVDAMSAEVRQRYSALRERSAQLQAAVEATQHQLDLLTARKSHLDTELAASPLKQEAATHYDKLSYMEAKRAELLDEQNARETPEQERERLLKQVKRDNQEMGALERRIHELRAEITKSGEDLEIAENVSFMQGYQGM
ncbi:Intraflagellar transport protein 74 [Amphibalanus amphitrite]|uniref:Intraflagellar transport protein 74 n=1 Tax=Amphibalanus amphitrite TaxID=1232801 RepID=A0A6A4W299_AMPAM|nr:Intraflagellar transport protein 74 [Amphibalanus amphitrite]